MANKHNALTQAIEITKEHCRGGNDKVSAVYTLETVYKKIVELQIDADNG